MQSHHDVDMASRQRYATIGYDDDGSMQRANADDCSLTQRILSFSRERGKWREESHPSTGTLALLPQNLFEPSVW